MIFIFEIYKKAQEVLDSLDGLPINEQEFILWHALRTLQVNGMIDDIADSAKELRDGNHRADY